MDRQHAIRQEQASSLYEGQPLVALGNLGGAVCGVLILFNTRELSRGYIALWFLLFLGHTLASFLYRARVHRTDLADSRKLARWFRCSVINLGSLGLLWSALFLPLVSRGDTAYQFAVLSGAAMLGAGAMAGVGAHPPTYRAFFLVLLLPVTLGLIVQGNWLTFGMGLAALLFIAFMLWSGNRFNVSYVESLRLRFENLDLVQQLTRKKDAAENAALAKSRFFAAASHDLRQPMYALNLYHGALADAVLSDDARQILSNAQQCAKAMDGMFSVLLDMSRLDAGVVQPAVRAFRLQEMLDRIQVEFALAAEQKGLVLRVAKSSAVIKSDPALAERIVRNLVANAVSHAGHGHILVGCRRRGDRLRVVVADTGIGIAEDKLTAVFEEYVQLDNPERDRNKGLGLGLAIVQRLARLLETPVLVQSQPGRGSSFMVDFARGTLTDQAAGEAAKSVLRGDLRGRLIAVIENEGMIREATTMVLEKWGCTVVAAGGGDEAVELLAMSPRPPDAIICDYRLRGDENGLDAIEKLRAEFCSDVPALLVTGDTAPERIKEIRDSGTPMLHKPLQPELLRVALLQACIGGGTPDGMAMNG